MVLTYGIPPEFRGGVHLFIMFIVEAVKPVFSACSHDGGCPRAAKPKHSHFKGGIGVSSTNPHSIRLTVELLSLLVNADGVSPSATSTEFDAT